MANSLEIDLTEVFEENMAKFNKRDRYRFESSKTICVAVLPIRPLNPATIILIMCFPILSFKAIALFLSMMKQQFPFFSA
jgi:hypothetical protein